MTRHYIALAVGRVKAALLKRPLDAIKRLKMTLFNDVDEASKYVDEFKGKPEELELAISDELQDPIGMNMALITDRILAKGWEPDGFKQKNGYRIYLYKEME